MCEIAPRDFVLTKWQERAAERGLPEPRDLSMACKFAAAFAQGVYGGDIEANELHTWVRLNGQVIDLTHTSHDTQMLYRGEVPESMKHYVDAHEVEMGELYSPDEHFMASPDFKESMASNRPRVEAWLVEYRAQCNRPSA